MGVAVFTDDIHFKVSICDTNPLNANHVDSRFSLYILSFKQGNFNEQ